MADGGSNGARLREWFDRVWNKRDPEAVRVLFAPDGIAYGIRRGEVDVHGPEEFIEFHQRLVAAFSEMHFSIQAVLEDGDLTAARFVVTGTHDGDGLGIPATNRDVVFHGMSFARWRDGKIVEGWNNYDQLGLLQQIGAMDMNL